MIEATRKLSGAQSHTAAGRGTTIVLGRAGTMIEAGISDIAIRP